MGFHSHGSKIVILEHVHHSQKPKKKRTKENEKSQTEMYLYLNICYVPVRPHFDTHHR